jgi:hypothetical protein
MEDNTPEQRIEQIAENPVAIEEWSCPVTVWILNDPPLRGF